MDVLKQLREQLKETELQIGRCLNDDGEIHESIRKSYLNLRLESQRLNELIKEVMSECEHS